MASSLQRGCYSPSLPKNSYRPAFAKRHPSTSFSTGSKPIQVSPSQRHQEYGQWGFRPSMLRCTRADSRLQDMQKKPDAATSAGGATNGSSLKHTGGAGLSKTFSSTLEHADEAHLRKWREEIEHASGGQSKDGNWNDLAWVQAQIDKRCVANMRMLVVDSIQEAKAGHPGLPLGMTEVGYFLYRKAMRHNPRNPSWFNRDRFVLSAGHGCLLQYICLHLAGYSSVQIEDLKRLCKLGSRTPGHPENVTTHGIEVTTGPLGQGVANAVGLAIAEKHLAARFNKQDCTLVDHRTFCIMGDGCAMEGISNEAASLAGHLKLNKLTVIYDDNHNTIDGDTSLAFSEDVTMKFQAFGWNTINVENVYDDLSTFESALDEALKETQKPTFIRVKSRIGRLSKKENTFKAHHGTFDEEDVKHMRDAVGWDNREPFYVSPLVYKEFEKQIEQGQALEEQWNGILEEYKQKNPSEGAEFLQLVNNQLPEDWDKVLPTFSMDDPVDATRGYSEKCLNALATVFPGLLGGSADLASSNKAYLKDFGDFKPDTPWGRNIRYGIREHAMAGISNGIALHGSGLIPFAATFLVFSDYMKNAMRLSALSEAGVVYVCTHDSIGLGEDGPTHQPVEQLIGLRAIPNMFVFRPADGNETAGAYKAAIKRRKSPSVIVLSRQKVWANVAGTSSDKVERGGYIVSDNSYGKPELIIMGTGSELYLCESAAEKLREEGRKIRVVSLVCWALFNEQDANYQQSVLPDDVDRRMSVEAGSPLGWKEYVGTKGHVVGVNTFGESGAYLDVLKKFGFTPESILDKARRMLSH
ncbi:hypothetical protein L7F22_031312 [Adiantum nelumboides]|nr:hypothetical protein [Adiantum nelumboides]